MAHPNRVTLNFHELFLEKVRKYAASHRMKLNAVFKKAFETMEDSELNAQPSAPGKDSRDFDY